MVGRSTSKNKPSRTRPLGSLVLETVRLRAEFTRRSGCAAPSLSWPPAVLAAPHCIKTGISAAHRPSPAAFRLPLALGLSLLAPAQAAGPGDPPPPLPLLSILVSRTAAAAAMPLCWARGLRRQRRYSLGQATPLSSPPALRRLLYGSRIPFVIHADLSV